MFEFVGSAKITVLSLIERTGRLDYFFNMTNRAVGFYSLKCKEKEERRKGKGERGKRERREGGKWGRGMV